MVRLQVDIAAVLSAVGWGLSQVGSGVAAVACIVWLDTSLPSTRLATCTATPNVDAALQRGDQGDALHQRQKAQREHRQSSNPMISLGVLAAGVVMLWSTKGIGKDSKH